MAVDNNKPTYEFSAPLFGLGLLLVGAATLALSFIAVSAYRLDQVVSSSLPCEPVVITNPKAMIDPVASELSGMDPSNVAASRAHYACMSDTRDLFQAEGVSSVASSLYWPMILMVDLGAGALLAVGWLSAGVSNMTKKHSVPLMALTAVMAIAGSAQVYFADTINIVSWIVD